MHTMLSHCRTCSARNTGFLPLPDFHSQACPEGRSRPGKAFPTAASSPLLQGSVLPEVGKPFPFPREGRFRSPSSIHPAILLRRRLVRILPGASLSRAHTRAQTSGFRVQRGDSQYACDSHGPSCSARHLHRIRSEQPERCAGEQRAICKPHGSPRPSCRSEH